MSEYQSQSGQHPQINPPGGLAKISGVPQQAEGTSADLEPISLVDEAPGEVQTPSKIHGLRTGMGAVAQAQYKRQPFTTGQGATRVRSFHGRMSDEGLQFMDDKINEWIDAHPEVEVKFVTTNIGVFEGKIREPALVLNLWY